MRWMMRWFLLLGCLLALALPLLADEVEEDEEGGSTLDPGLQWKLADAAWNRRQYDDAAVLSRTFAEMNPDANESMEAWWRAYHVYRHNRPNEAKRKAVFDKAMEATVRWERKYAASNKERAAQAMFYRSQIVEQELGRPQGILVLQEAVKKYTGTPYDDDIYWRLAEWLRESGRHQEAIPNYQAQIKAAGNTEWAVMSGFRLGWMYEEIKDKASAVEAYKQVLNNPEYNWHWGQMHWGALDAARRLKAMGEEEAARAAALKLLDKTPKEWTDLRGQASALLGQAAKKITIYPHLNYNYSTDKTNINAQSKLTLKRDLPVLVRLAFVTKDDPFKGSLTLIPKVDVEKAPENMQKGEADGKTAYTAQIVAPDDKGSINTDWWYRFTEGEHQESPPDGLVLTRKWEKMGNTWGECTIRIQSGARWHIWIYLPNEKTNPNNITGRIGDQAAIQPNEVHEGGKTFRWYDWYDLNQGMTIKFPVEVGENVTEFYPRMRLERHAGGRGYSDKNALGAEAIYDMKEFVIKLTSPAAFPYSVNFTGTTVVEIAGSTK